MKIKKFDFKHLLCFLRILELHNSSFVDIIFFIKLLNMMSVSIYDEFVYRGSMLISGLTRNRRRVVLTKKGILSLISVTEFFAWMNNYNNGFKWDTIIHPCLNFTSDLTNPILKSGHEYFITIHRKSWL